MGGAPPSPWVVFSVNSTLLAEAGINPPPDKIVWAIASGTTSADSGHVLGFDYQLRDPLDLYGSFNGYTIQIYLTSDGKHVTGRQNTDPSGAPIVFDWHRGARVSAHFLDRVPEKKQWILLLRMFVGLLQNRRDQLDRAQTQRSSLSAPGADHPVPEGGASHE